MQLFFIKLIRQLLAKIAFKYFFEIKFQKNFLEKLKKYTTFYTYSINEKKNQTVIILSTELILEFQKDKIIIKDTELTQAIEYTTQHMNKLSEQKT